MSSLKYGKSQTDQPMVDSPLKDEARYEKIIDGYIRQQNQPWKLGICDDINSVVYHFTKFL